MEALAWKRFRNPRVYGVLCAVLLMGLHALYGPLVYWGESLSARVVFGDEAVEGAFVLAAWELELFSVGHGPREGSCMRAEVTRTRADGSFEFDAWGPSIRPPLQRLAGRDPILTVYHQGFWPKQTSDERSMHSWLRKPMWNDGVIELQNRSEKNFGRILILSWVIEGMERCRYSSGTALTGILEMIDAELRGLADLPNARYEVNDLRKRIGAMKGEG